MKNKWIWLAVLVCALALGFSAYTYFSSRDIASQIGVYQAQLETNAAIQKKIDKQQENVDRREKKIEEYLAQLEIEENEKTRASLERAYEDRNKAVKERDKQVALLNAEPSSESQRQAISALKRDSAISLMLIELGIVVCLISFIFLGYIRAHVRVRGMVLLGVILFALSGAIVLAGGYRYQTVEAAAASMKPGVIMICVGVVLAAISLCVCCLSVRSFKLEPKSMIGTGLFLMAGVLVALGLNANYAPDAKEHYINAMSPGLLRILGGLLTAVAGGVFILCPLKSLRKDLKKNPMLLAMMLPSVAYFIVLNYLPMVGVYFGFTNLKFSTTFFGTLFGSQYVGLANFRYLFASGTVWRLTFNTVVYNLIFIIIGTILKIAIAIMFSEISGKRYKKAVQTITFLPHFISMVMIGTFAYGILNYNTGIINTMLMRLGLGRIDFYGIPWAWYIIIPMFEFWKSVGYGSIIYVSAITGISDELYEAADLDGASFMQEIRHVTLPCLRPTIVILVLMSLGNIMRGSFDLFYQLVGRSGRLFNATEIIDTYVWRALRDDGGTQIGRGSAAGLYQSFVGMILVVTVNGIVKKVEPDYSIF